MSIEQPSLAQFGIIGLGVMGQNLALNIERNGYKVVVWNREPEKSHHFAGSHADKKILVADSLQEFTAALTRPRKILLMVKAGEATDWTIDLLRPHLEPGDIIIDGGNSHFPDTQRREKALAEAGFQFIGSGVSGGETGALWGPSLMPGGPKKAYEQIRPIFEAIAAKVDDGPCVTHIGPDGAGHFVKMVHNGIEYGDMQLIAEAYDILRRIGGLSAPELAEVFALWNQGPLNSFLIEITAKVLSVKDEATGQPLVDLILDKAGQKGTGRWTSQVALELGVAIPTIHAAIESRVLSGLKLERVRASAVYPPAASSGQKRPVQELIACVHDALYASKICSYAQGMALIQAGSAHYNWNINLAELARIWKGGCIIRAQFLDEIQQAYGRDAHIPNLLLDSKFSAGLKAADSGWRRAVTLAQAGGLPVLAMSASLAYFDAYRTDSLPLNLTQAQRDYFGSHLYERIDQPELGLIHTDWIRLTSAEE